VKRCHLVQVADYAGRPGFPCRAVRATARYRSTHPRLDQEAGYRGAFDLELMGPRIDREEHCEAVRRQTAERSVNSWFAWGHRRRQFAFREDSDGIRRLSP
jgi:hypothetical protein